MLEAHIACTHIRCYWPLMSFALNADLSDGFWCFVRDFTDKYGAIQDLAFDSDSDVVHVMRGEDRYKYN